MKAAKIEDYVVIGSVKGKNLEYIVCAHPFLDRDSLVIVGDHVTLDSGTGCVHTAPGHGVEDFEVCVNHYPQIPIVVPVDNVGKLTKDAGEFEGLTTDEANKAIAKKLEDSNLLFAVEKIVHQYPHCWRCKHPIIYRATEQWFCSVEDFKEDAVREIEKIKWIPGWGEGRIKNMVTDRSDWCISRQRLWGVPIPIFYCEECGEFHIDEQSVKAVSDLFRKEGSDAWWTHEAEEILPKGTKCKKCGCEKFRKETDIMDVWFDSGSTHVAAMQRDQGFWPADMYIEGGDQYRGWFQSSLLVAVGALGRGAPFKECVTHGWTVDGEGKAMHKSLGNGMDPAEIINEFGADMLRLWAGSADYHADMRCSKEIFKQLTQNYLKFRNTARYCLGNLDGFDAEHLVAPEDMLPLDRWAITKLNDLIRRVAKAYDNYEFHVVSHAINDFCVVELSSFYLDIIKDRLYCEERNGLKRRSAQTALFLILDSMTKMFAPILAFTCDEIWLAMPHRTGDDERNVLLNEMVQPYTQYALSPEEMARWDRIAAVRTAVNGALVQARADKTSGKSLEAEVDLTVTAEDAFLTDMDAADLADLLIVSQVRVEVGAELTVAVRPPNGAKCMRSWKVLPTVASDAGHPDLCPRCAAVVKNLPVIE